MLWDLLLSKSAGQSEAIAATMSICRVCWRHTSGWIALSVRTEKWLWWWLWCATL